MKNPHFTSNNKVAIITDTHFGARNDSPAFSRYFKKFYDEIRPKLSDEKTQYYYAMFDKRLKQHYTIMFDEEIRRHY